MEPINERYYVKKELIEGEDIIRYNVNVQTFDDVVDEINEFRSIVFDERDEHDLCDFNSLILLNGEHVDVTDRVKIIKNIVSIIDKATCVNSIIDITLKSTDETEWYRTSIFEIHKSHDAADNSINMLKRDSDYKELLCCVKNVKY